MSNYKLSSPVDVSSSSVNGQINMYGAGSAFAVQVKAPAGLVANVDFTLPTTVGTTGQFLQRTGASSLGWVTKSGASIGSSLPVQINFSIANLPTTPLNFAVTGNFVISYFMYNGSTSSASPTRFTIICGTTVLSIFTLLVFDITNGNNILAPFSSFLPTGNPNMFIITTGFINIPPAQAVFRISINVTNVTTPLLIYSMSMN